MPLAKIHVRESRYDEPRLAKLGEAIQGALEAVLKVPPEDDYRVIHILPAHRFVHTRGGRRSRQHLFGSSMARDLEVLTQAGAWDDGSIITGQLVALISPIKPPSFGLGPN